MASAVPTSNTSQDPPQDQRTDKQLDDTSHARFQNTRSLTSPPSVSTKRNRQESPQQQPTESGAAEDDYDSDEEFWKDHAVPTRSYSATSGVQRSSTIGKPNFPSSSSANPLQSYSINTSSLKSKGKVSKKDGLLHISVHDTANKGYLAKTLSAGIKHHLRALEHEKKRAEKHNKKHVKDDQEPEKPDTSLKVKPIPKENIPMPKLNIVIQVIGSRGDIQPFIKIGRILKEKHGHRVRIATHLAFKKFIEEDCGLEFFSVGGNPSELMAFMVKNPGLIPSIDTIMKGEIGRRRDQMAEMFEGFFRSCVCASDDPNDPPEGTADKKPFVADAIIANPPSFAHIHCAERLGCPLHIIFTFPWTPTQSFPHPLTSIKQSSVDPSYANFMSYPLCDLVQWQGLGDLINDFREHTLWLDPISTIWAPGQLYRLKVPTTYLWSPGLCPKPSDWGPEVDVAGFVFLDLASHFTPPQDLKEFLEAGDKPIYIGFGSIVIDDPDKFTKMIFQAVDKAGVRAVINKGWGGFGGGDVPDNCFMIDNVPHDWLFPRCQAVVHHGGAGTTAIGLKCAKPTMIVPFFGDQNFWGHRVAEAKAGAFECIPYKELDLDKFVEGIKQCLTDEARKNVQQIADSIEREGDGAENAVESFLARLPMSGNRNMRCSVLQNRSAVWQVKGSHIRLSALAAELLLSQGKLSKRELRLYRQNDWTDFQGAGGPLTGGGGAIVNMITNFGKGMSAGPYHLGRDVHRRASHQKRKMAHEHRKRQRERRRKSQEVDTAQSPAKQSTDENQTEPFPGLDNGMPGTSTQNTAGITEEIDHAVKASAENPEKDADQAPPKQIVRGTGDIQRHETETSTISADPEGTIYIDVARDTAEGIWRPVGAIVRFPMDLFVGLGNGFHNAPRLYGDTTVRRPIRITGIKSGMQAAGSELMYGTWDAFSGLVTQPYKGAKKFGPLGFVTGIGKGIGGLVLKECAALTGPFGYVMNGVYREALKNKTPIHEIRHSRHRQGQDEIEALNPETRKEAEEAAKKGWKVMGHLWSEMQKMKSGKLIPGGEEKEEGSWVGDRWISGMTGRYHLAKEKEQWEKFGAFDSAERMQKFAEGRRRGMTLEQIAENLDREETHEENTSGGPAEHGGETADKNREARLKQNAREEKEAESEEPRSPELVLQSPMLKKVKEQLGGSMDSVPMASPMGAVH